MILKTTNGPIEGRFYAEKFIMLDTKNAPIDAEIELYNDISRGPASSMSYATVLTTNAYVPLPFPCPFPACLLN